MPRSILRCRQLIGGDWPADRSLGILWAQVRTLAPTATTFVSVTYGYQRDFAQTLRAMSLCHQELLQRANLDFEMSWHGHMLQVMSIADLRRHYRARFANIIWVQFRVGPASRKLKPVARPAREPSQRATDPFLGKSILTPRSESRW